MMLDITKQQPEHQLHKVRIDAEIIAMIEAFFQSHAYYPKYLYLGYEDYNELRAALETAYYYLLAPDETAFRFHGLEIVEVSRKRFLEIG